MRQRSKKCSAHMVSKLVSMPAVGGGGGGEAINANSILWTQKFAFLRNFISHKKIIKMKLFKIIIRNLETRLNTPDKSTAEQLSVIYGPHRKQIFVGILIIIFHRLDFLYILYFFLIFYNYIFQSFVTVSKTTKKNPVQTHTHT